MIIFLRICLPSFFYLFPLNVGFTVMIFYFTLRSMYARCPMFWFCVCMIRYDIGLLSTLQTVWYDKWPFYANRTCLCCACLLACHSAKFASLSLSLCVSLLFFVCVSLIHLFPFNDEKAASSFAFLCVSTCMGLRATSLSASSIVVDLWSTRRNNTQCHDSTIHYPRSLFWASYATIPRFFRFFIFPSFSE